jgi:type IV fimbrial biogenesis protein FimT
VLTGRQHGFTMIELLIGLAILGILVTLGFPEFQTFIRNTKVKNVAQSIESGLQLARAEAIRRNVNVRFQLVNNLTGSCAVTSALSSSPNWVVSLDDPAGKCEIAPSETTSPRIVQKWDSRESASGIVWNITMLTMTGALTFNGLGRISPALSTAGPSPSVAQIRVEPLPGTDIACEHLGGPVANLRCMRILVNNGGQIRMCDPKVTDATDPRIC